MEPQALAYARQKLTEPQLSPSKEFFTDKDINLKQNMVPNALEK